MKMLPSFTYPQVVFKPVWIFTKEDILKNVSNQTVDPMEVNGVYQLHFEVNNSIKVVDFNKLTNPNH